VGTASLRRQAQLLNARPDITVIPLRGNVDTRLGKLRSGEVYATFLARAGLNRLGRAEAAAAPLEADEMLPAVAQGAIGVAVRRDDADALARARMLNHNRTEFAITAERAFLKALDGSCRTPIAAHLNNESMDLIGEVLTPDGRIRWRDASRIDLRTASLEDADRAGKALGTAIRKQAGPRLKDVLGSA
jgi:hydroxymethylbilane synthase